jgi:acyl-CoA thioester hydrolase
MDKKTRKHGKDDVRYLDVPVRVRYADTDRMGIVYYGNYPAYFEIGRSEYMRNLGFAYRSLEDMGYFLVVVEMEAKYYNSATYDDLITVKTGVWELKSRGITFHYRIFNGPTLLVEGRTRHVCLNSEKKPVVMPQMLLDVLNNGPAA